MDLQLTLYPAPVLRKVAEPVEAFDEGLRATIERMFEVMRESKGVGLAAPQVGLRQRILVLNATGELADDLALVNVKILDRFGPETSYEEGCLSFPEIYAEVTRPECCRISAQTPDGAPLEREFDGFESRIVQHEYDHLEGVLLVDRMSPADKQRHRAALEELVEKYKSAHPAAARGPPALITTLDARRIPPPPAGGAVVSIGVFDGVHRGHQAILAANRERAGDLGAAATVVTFRRHPKRVLLGRAPRMLTSLEHRLELFRRAGMDHTLVLTFDEELRQLEAEDFVRRFLVEGLDARAFVLGFDSKFGRERRGTPDLLSGLGFDVQVIGKVLVGERGVSSTVLREAVELGDLAGASQMLGRPVSILGTVVRGDARGRELGFPTANLDLHHELHPPPGVYAGYARLLAREGEPSALHPAVANIGYRPTVDGEPPDRPLVEVHLLDFEGDLYGRQVELFFAAALRGERRFGSLEELSAAIAADVARAREVLAAGSGKERGIVDARGGLPR